MNAKQNLAIKNSIHIKDFFFPKSCYLCGDNDCLLCDGCVASLEPAHLKCLRCSKLNPSGLYCLECAKPSLPERAFAIFRYDASAKELVHEMKYKDLFEMSKPLGKLLSDALNKIGDFSKFTVTFVPVDKRRKRYRGYNQAELLAREVSEHLGLQCEEILARIKKTESQIYTDSYLERRQNVRGSIEAVDKIEGNYLLIDDVITSGATIEEATKILHRAGAKKVVAAAICLG